MLSRLLRRGPTTPRLSIVVPVYNVERYLADCLKSLAAQTSTDVEVVLVDDGSTDRSAAIAQRFVRRHRSWRLLQTENRGMGAARNVGVRHAAGTYLGFLDADDLLPPDAHALLVSTLEQSGSDFVVGSLRRLVDGELMEPGWIKRPHERRRLGIAIDDLPEILVNVFAWTKVFRRSFYDAARLSFPEGVRYEDQVSSTEAYLKASRFDVVRRPVYYWRVRDDGTSITQRRHELSDLSDRIRTKHMTTDLVRELGSPAVLDQWARNGLPGDLPRYFEQIPGCDDAYWAMLSAGVRDLFPGLPPIEESHLALPQRLVGWLVGQDRRADAETVLAWLREHRGPLASQLVDGEVRAVLPFADDPSSGIPPGLFRFEEGAV